MKWCKIFFASINLIDEEMFRFFEILGKKLAVMVKDDSDSVLLLIYNSGLEAFNSTEPEERSYIDTSSLLGEVASGYIKDLIAGDRRSAVERVMEV